METRTDLLRKSIDAKPLCDLIEDSLTSANCSEDAIEKTRLAHRIVALELRIRKASEMVTCPDIVAGDL